MEASRLAQLLRKAARQVSRRETLGALVGSALLNDRGQLESTQRAEQRAHRHHPPPERAQPHPVQDHPAGAPPPGQRPAPHPGGPLPRNRRRLKKVRFRAITQ